MTNTTIDIGNSSNTVDVVVNGSISTNKLKAPTTSNGSDLGVGSDKQVLKSNGTNIYWGDAADADAITTEQVNTICLMETTEDLDSTLSELITNISDDLNGLKKDLNDKVGYAEQKDGVLNLYTDSTKQKLIISIILPTESNNTESSNTGSGLTETQIRAIIESYNYLTSYVDTDTTYTFRVADNKLYIKPSNTSEYSIELPTQTDAYTKTESDDKYQPKGNYALNSEIPTSEISANTSARHSHSNIDLLDSITEERINKWDGNESNSNPLGKVLIFGDSLSSGFNGETNKNEPESGYRRWSYYLTNAEEVRNFAVGGSCFGSGYAPSDSVTNMALENMITSHEHDIEWADLIVIGYGGNDINAVMGGKTTPENVINKAISCVASIKAINPYARLVYAYVDLNTQIAIDNTAITKAHLIDALSYILYCNQIEIVRITYGSYLTTADLQSDKIHPNDIGITKIGTQMNRLLCNPASWTPSNRIKLYFGNPLGTVNPLGYKFPYIELLSKYGMEIILVLDYEGTMFYAIQSFVNYTNKIATWTNHSYITGSKLSRFSLYISNSGGGVTNFEDA